ncbi:hypothetical protein Tco_1378118 [Tanacetum coccineum]
MFTIHIHSLFTHFNININDFSKQSINDLFHYLYTNEYQSTVHHNSYSQQPSIPHLEYAPTTYQQQQPEFSQTDSSLVVPVFQKGDDPIDAINHMMSFLTAVVTSRDCTTIQGRQTTYAAETTRKFTPEQVVATREQRRLFATICKGEGHIAKQCTKPKRKRDDTWFNDKVLLVQAQAGGQALKQRMIAFLGRSPDSLTFKPLDSHYPQCCLSKR